MRERRVEFFLLLLVGLLLLVSIVATPSLVPASPTGEYDYVDNNISNVDASPDKGTHSNFTLQQYGPDSIYDTLVEENTGEAFLLEDFVDNDISDVDNSPDVGSHSNFENHKNYDSVYDTLTEQNTGGEITKVGTDTSGTGTSLTLSFSHTLVSGTARIVIVSIGVENGDTIDVSTVTYGGVTMTLAVEGITGTSGYRYLCEIWYILEDDLPSDGSKTVAITCTGTANALEINAFCSEYTGVSQGAPEATAEHHQTSGTTITNTISPSTNAWVVSAVGSGNVGNFAHDQGQVEVLEFDDSSSTFAVAELRGAGGETSLSSIYSGTVNRLCRVAASWTEATEDDNYELDLEIQFTAVIDFLSTETLCINTGTFSGTEDVSVDFWNGIGWENLATDLTANSWNNYTVSLTSTPFTIRLKGGAESDDPTQDTWQIDASLLRVEESGGKEDSVDNDTSNVDSSGDYGTLSNFDNMKTKDGMATLTEGLSTAWSNNTQPSALILETAPDISGLAATYETYGLANLALDDGTYGGGDIQDNGATNDPQEVSLIMEFDYSGLGISGSDISYLRFEAEAYFIGGTGRAPTNDPWEMETTFYSGSVDIYNWDSGSWEIMGTVFIDDPADLSIWDNTGDVNPERPLIRFKDSSFSDAYMSSTGFIRIRIQMTGVFQGTAYDGCSVIDYVDVDLQYGGGDDYILDHEVQWTDLPYQLPNEELCIYGGTMGNEDIKVEAWNGTGWETVFTDLSSGWNNNSVTDWLDGPIFTIRFKGGNESGDTTQDQWQIDIALIHVWSAVNYELDLEVQWTNATYDLPNAELCIFGGTMGSENIRVDVWYGSTWHNLFTDLSSGWNNISVTNYLISPTFTIRFKAVTETGDTSQDSWEIDCTLLHTWGVLPIANFSYTPQYPYTGETVTFNASDSYDPDGAIISFFWGFGDSTNGTGEIVTHTYADDRTYTVTLTVTDNDGLSDTTFADVTVLNRPPVASFTESAETVLTGEPIYFNSSASYDPDGTIISYFWDFGDGDNATGTTVEHAYSDNGTYTVTLQVTDDDGATETTNATKTVLNRPPVNLFTESAETVYTSQPITFNASDSYDPDGSIVSYFWDFGDGTNATGVIVEHAYADDGNYTVTLMITDDDGATASVSATKTVLNSPPIAVFTESAETVYTGEVIYFNASDSYDPDGTIVSYFWDFGDGTNATGVVTEHAYADNENYPVILTVTDDDGASATSTATKTILNRPPVAIFTESTETAYVGETITFNASDSYDSDGYIATYFWDFGDGANTTGIIVEHTYSTNGTYIVTLIITDDDGASASTSSTKTILRNEPPVATFTETAETVYTSETIYFNASDSYDSDGYIVSYFWDFGDGTNATGVTVDHAYLDDGVYTVTLAVTDDRGATSSNSSTKTVLNRFPIASFTESAETVDTGEAIIFNATNSYDSDGTIISYFWNFDDGTNATGMIVAHSYTDNGTYTVTLTVTDDDGATASTNATKTVLNRSPVADFTESAETVYTGEAIIFNATDSYDSDGYIVSYFWDFGDGTNATGVVVSHAYVDDGTYTVTLMITDDDGATASVSATKTVLNSPPVAVFTESAETVYTSEVIAFNASDSYDPDGTIVSYFWDFGDATNATGITVEHAYAEDGIYTVTLTITDDEGAVSTTTATKTVLNRFPIASFTESAETVDTGEVIVFNASESHDPDGTIVSCFWDFSDGTNATGVVVEHAYADDGNYTVTLIVTDDDGATATATATKYVLNRPPVANFTESAETVYTGETITFNASASFDPDGMIVSFFWDFGDGTNATGVIVEHAYADDGIFTVTLTVTDDDGATDTATSTKTVLNRPPVVSFTESAETVYTGETITFNASSSYDPDGVIVSYFWDFGDGANATGVVVSHAYVDDGNYTVTLIVTDDDGATAASIAAKNVLNRSPLAFFTESAETVYAGEVIYFNASQSYDPDGYIVSCFWDFGDDVNSTGVAVEHSYADDGNYTVTLTVTDDDGASASTAATKNVLNRLPIASFTESAETVYTNEPITFNATSSYDPDGTIISYFWDFGDGINTTGAIVSHSYVDNGFYTVILTVTDNDGATASTSATKTILNRSPVASFTESAETVYTGETITFNASASYDSDGTIVSYFWDFGDDTNATGVVVTHAYADDGTYMVILTVTDDDGATDTTTATKTVLNRSPVADFTESAETVYTGEAIIFNATDSYDSDGYIVSYFWNFGDGTNATGVVVSHAYADDGTYTVTLMITDDDGATASVSATKTVLNSPPVAVFTESAETVYTSEVIAFNASDSHDPDGTVVSYFWDFGDGSNATGVTTQHAYADDGNYTVTLTVTDNDGASTSTSTIKTVLNRAPVAVFTESAETVLTGEIITFDASDSYDPDGTIVSYFWDFGDGTNATIMTIGHAYADDGNYTVTLTVTDDDGAIAIATAAKTVLNRPPVATFTTSATTALTGQVVYFDASDSHDPDGTIVSYFWDFGDGSNATGVTTQHAYADDGTYVVTLTVTDDDGATGVATATIQVLNRAPVAIFTESAETVYTGETVTFNASGSHDPDGYIVSFFWDFGDGTNATGMTVTHAYAEDGSYTVTLTVTDDDGATDTTTATKTVSNRPPVAIFTESAETVLIDEAIYFNASDSYDLDGSIVSYFWDFGDGTNATSVTPEHAYSSSGVYVVTLTVMDNDGATGTATATKTVEVTPPVAVFTESAETVYTSEVIAFNASDSHDPDGTVVSYFWDFGDGSNATGVTTQHAYADDGNYTVTLTVTDNDGATDTASATKTVLNRLPIASFTESAETVYTSEVVTFNASVSYDLDGNVVSFFWDFGDGANATGVVVGHAYADDGNYTVTLTVTDDDGASASTTATKTVLNKVPVAIFTESAETVYTGESITFNASGSYDPDGTIVSYFWDFGDGANTSGAIVSHAYVDDGVYTVTLTVTDDDGATNTATATKTVLNRPPVASFTESAETVYTNEIITFNASDSYDLDGYIASYFWDFGDGTNATSVIVEHAYADDGTYIVTLTVTDDNGASASTSSTKTILNRPPAASFTESAETVFTGEVIYFNASGSYDPDGFIVTYSWDFGDGTNTTGAVVDHAYGSDGVYSATLTVTDNDGATASTSATKTVLNRSPVANFTESAESVLTGEVIYFNASGSYDPDGSIVSYFWDFGDGVNTSGVVVDHAYADDRNYTVTLTVTDDDGATDTATATKTVMNRPPVAIFTESAETVYTNEIITFNASASYDLDGYIVDYFWSFGDGTNATGVIVEHAYADDGAYTVTLTITDDDGATGTVTSTKTVLNRSPVASFTESAETVIVGEIIYFNASNSYDPDGAIVSYFWDFGDGTNATGVVVEHAYADDGTYAVTLTVTDDDSATDTTISIKTVLNRAPVAIFTESAESVLTGEVIYFNASDSYDPDGTIVSYFWDFGDGTNATGVTTEHSYSEKGTYIVTLNVTDDDGATASASATKMIGNSPPVAIFTESAETTYTGETITFDASDSYDPDGIIVSHQWDFGDGTNATGIVVGHAYTDDGNYTVTLTVKDDDGAVSTATAIKTILNRPPVAAFSASSTLVPTAQDIYFNASGSYDLDGTVASYFWDFGDGSNASGVMVTHAYADNGTYLVTLTVTDDDGASSTATVTIKVLNRLPVAVFTESAESVLTGEVVYFNASDSYDPDGTIASYFWDFGDGTNATGVTAEHSYSEKGTYIVALTVTDDDGATASASATKFVGNSPPVAIFTESAETVYTDEIIYFNASASYDPDGVIASYFWDFGDETNATGITVEHAYVDDGVYNVTLTVVDNDGATSTFTSSKTVLNTPPVAVFTESAESVLTGEVIYFNASGSYDPDGTIIDYLWDFGDGTNATGAIVSHAYADDSVYTVTLTVIDNEGAIETATSTKTVLNRPPVAIFTESAGSAFTGEPIYFNASDSYDLDGTVASYFWDFGDGSNATGIVVERAYADDGNYTVTLTVTDNDGATSPTSSTKTIYNRPPVSSFTHSPGFPIAGQNVTFDASASYDPDGYITNYTWDFGDGNIATATTAVITHVYAMEGNYPVLLNVTDDDGEMDAVISTLGIRNYPTATFTYSPTYPGEGQTVTFDASPSTPNGGVIVNYTWDFGDGNITTVTEPVVLHVYGTAENYTVTLTVTDSEELSNSQSKLVKVGKSPISSFTYSPDFPFVGDLVIFDASGSYDPDGYIISYLWDFGDGSPQVNETNPLTTHNYATGGNYTVTLVVTDNEGLSDTNTKIVTVNKAPVAVFTYAPDFPILGDTVTFNASESYDPNGYIASYTWDFDDGNITTVTTPAITHNYATEESYTVTLTVTDNDGYTDTTSDMVRVRNYPTATFTLSPDYPIAEETTTFDASSSSPNGGVIVNYFWNFGDGTLPVNTTAPITNHIYTATGNYTVTLTITDSEGLSDFTVDTLMVRGYPIPFFTCSPAIPYVGDTVSFDASSSVPNGGIITNYYWDFGDGSSLNATDPLTTHVFSEAGNYIVILIVTDSEGLTEETTKTVAIEKSPIASFNYFPEHPIRHEEITFNASESYDINGYIVSYTWDFDDGNITTVDTPIITHKYPYLATYTVTLTVTDNDGYVDTTMHAVKIRDFGYPVADFVYSPEFPSVEETVTFNASDSYDPNGDIAAYYWDFGDGTTTLEFLNPTITHQYASLGTYVVALTVTDHDGYDDTTSKTVTVRSNPHASFTWSPLIPQIGEVVTFDASASTPNGGTIVTYEWDFGDGNSALVTSSIITHSYDVLGDYIVTLNVTDSEGLSALATNTLKIGQAPVAYFTYTPVFPITEEIITFNASDSYDPDGTVVSYFWDFGDGTSATGVVVGHAYTDDGNYKVTLTVTDNDGLTSIIAYIVGVRGYPMAVFTYLPDNPVEGETITFDASSSSGIIVSYTWDFGDGNITTITDPVIYHVYISRGNYSVTLNVTDSIGLGSTTSKTIIISPPFGPIADFIWYPTVPKPNQLVTFDATSSTLGWNGTQHPPIVSYMWDFGDANITTVTNPVINHVYMAEGSYTTTLTIIDSIGQQDIVSYMIEIRNVTLIGDITGPEGVPDGIVDLDDAQFVAMRFGSYPGHDEGWGWDPRADITGPEGVPDGLIDLDDVLLVLAHFGETI